jgi:hypothetical protein
MLNIVINIFSNILSKSEVKIELIWEKLRIFTLEPLLRRSKLVSFFICHQQVVDHVEMRND